MEALAPQKRRALDSVRLSFAKLMNPPETTKRICGKEGGVVTHGYIRPKEFAEKEGGDVMHGFPAHGFPKILQIG